jgi:hypothetical protein
MKRFLIEIDDESWADICMEQGEAYGSMFLPPPLDEVVLYDYLCRKMDADLEWPDEMAGVTITEVPC